MEAEARDHAELRSTQLADAASSLLVFVGVSLGSRLAARGSRVRSLMQLQACLCSSVCLFLTRLWNLKGKF